MVKVKICGITNRADAVLATDQGADALGFIFHPRSPRYIEPAKAARIIKSLPPFVTKVGVVVNLQIAQLQELTQAVPLDLLQLHGDEDSKFCKGLLFPYLKVFRIAQGFDMSQLKRYDAAGFVLDTFEPDRYGGTGETFDWSLARDASRHGRIVLSGGINMGNVLDALNVVRPYAVDVCSGVEARPGKKDPTKLADFIRKVRGHSNNGR